MNAALHRALDRITREFSRPNNRAVTMARTMLRHPVSASRDAAARARYGAIGRAARQQRRDLAGTLTSVTRDYWMAASKRDLAVLRGATDTRALQIDCDILFEARLLLRWLRRHQAARFAEVVVLVGGENVLGDRERAA